MAEFSTCHLDVHLDPIMNKYFIADDSNFPDMLHRNHQKGYYCIQQIYNIIVHLSSLQSATLTFSTRGMLLPSLFLHLEQAAEAVP